MAHEEVIERRSVLSPWVTLLEVSVGDAARGGVFHGLDIADYAIVCARTTTGLFPVVRQFRPVLGIHTLEFPGGIVDPGEPPADTAARELLEEAGLAAIRVELLGSHWTDTGRLTNRTHAFFADTDAIQRSASETDVELLFFTREELEAAIADNRFGHFLHVAAYALAKLRGLLP